MARKFQCFRLYSVRRMLWLCIFVSSVSIPLLCTHISHLFYFIALFPSAWNACIMHTTLIYMFCAIIYITVQIPWAYVYCILCICSKSNNIFIIVIVIIIAMGMSYIFTLIFFSCLIDSDCRKPLVLFFIMAAVFVFCLYSSLFLFFFYFVLFFQPQIDISLYFIRIEHVHRRKCLIK